MNGANEPALNDTTLPAALADQPLARVDRDGVRYTLLGTAHVSKESVAAVETALASGAFDVIAVELDPARHRALTDPNALAKLDLVQAIKSGKAGLLAANLALAAYQRRLSEQLGVEPGAELKAAAVGATARGLPMVLIDRDIGLTFKRAWGRLGFWKRSMLGAGLFTSLIVDEKVEDDAIEKLKQGDVLEASFAEFAGQSPELFEAVIAERDRYMVAKLREAGAAHPGKHVLAVVGAGHLAGLAAALETGSIEPATQIAELEALPKDEGMPWFTIILVGLLLGGFAWGWHQGGIETGGMVLLQWAAITAAGGALGCLAAGGHPLSILAAALASPITPLHPALGSGTISALVEAWVRKPDYADFLALRDDTRTLRGWWKNRVARTLLNFFLTSVGTALAVWAAGAGMIAKLL
ncbi:TraB/GumN family protein [Silanimonas sp.]|uniref:TraB/GumN family protein n=1 Tax=Silanimonas sp. TaxID=1929290 RepID=UPI0037C57AFF